VWDDTKGMLQYPLASFRYAYRKSPNGKFKSVYGDTLDKVTNFNETDDELFESDVPMETRALIDLYGDTDEMSTNHRVVYIDIEVDSTGGFPNVEEADKEITAIALYDQLSTTYYALVLDPDSRVNSDDITIKPKNGAKLEVRGYSNEIALLSAFLNLWEELAPTIVTGWNCIPLTQSVWGKDRILRMKDVVPGKLHDSDLLNTFPMAVKEKWCITLANGSKIYSSGDHKFPVRLVNPSNYITFQESSHSDFFDIDLRTRQIASFSGPNDVYCQVVVRNNTNPDNPNYTTDQLYLAGLIYTDWQPEG
jgi:hypothetical protein